MPVALKEPIATEVSVRSPAGFRCSVSIITGTRPNATRPASRTRARDRSCPTHGRPDTASGTPPALRRGTRAPTLTAAIRSGRGDLVASIVTVVACPEAVIAVSGPAFASVRVPSLARAYPASALGPTTTAASSIARLVISPLAGAGGIAAAVAGSATTAIGHAGLARVVASCRTVISTLASRALGVRTSGDRQGSGLRGVAVSVSPPSTPVVFTTER